VYLLDLTIAHRHLHRSLAVRVPALVSNRPCLELLRSINELQAIRLSLAPRMVSAIIRFPVSVLAISHVIQMPRRYPVKLQALRCRVRRRCQDNRPPQSLRFQATDSTFEDGRASDPLVGRHRCRVSEATSEATAPLLVDRLKMDSLR
jgi:hypothetical protein